MGRSMKGVIVTTKVNLGPPNIHEGERRGQSSETAIEASTRTNFCFTNDRTFLIGSKRRHSKKITELLDVGQM